MVSRATTHVDWQRKVKINALGSNQRPLDFKVADDTVKAHVKQVK